MEDIGKLLFSFTIEPDMEWKEFRYMGRSVRYATSRNTVLFTIAVVIAIVFMAIFVSAMLLAVLAIVAVNVALYMEYSASDIAHKIRGKTPLKYEFYEDGLIEYDSNGSHTILYTRFRYIKSDSHSFVMMGKETDVVVIPKSHLDQDAQALLYKLSRILAKRK